jgi:hypothetical protein
VFADDTVNGSASHAALSKKLVHGVNLAYCVVQESIQMAHFIPPSFTSLGELFTSLGELFTSRGELFTSLGERLNHHPKGLSEKIWLKSPSTYENQMWLDNMENHL